MHKLNKEGGITVLNEDETEKQKLSQLDSIYYLAKKSLTYSDKYLIRLIWKRYCKLYKQVQLERKSGVITPLMKEYPTRRRYYLNMIDEICENI